MINNPESTDPRIENETIWLARRLSGHNDSYGGHETKSDISPFVHFCSVAIILPWILNMTQINANKLVISILRLNFAEPNIKCLSPWSTP